MKKLFRNPFFICCIISFFTFILYSLDTFSTLDNKLYDNLMKFANEIPAAPVVIVAIDDLSIAHFKIWPWPRKIYGDLVNILVSENARVIAFDINFDSYASYNPEDDTYFGDSIKAARNVVLAQQIVQYQNQVTIVDPINKLKANATLGVVHPFQDSDNTIRRAFILRQTNNNLYPDLALSIVSRYLALPLNKQTTRIYSSHINLGQLNIPLDLNKKMIIHYTGPAGTFPTIPVSKLFEPGFFKANPNIFKDKIVIIGATALYLKDIFPTPTSMGMPGAEIHANIVNTILSKKFITTIPHILYLFIILLPSLLITFLTCRHKAIKGLVFLIVIFASIIAVSIFSIHNSIILNISAATTSLLFAYLAAVLFLFIKEEKEKESIRDIFNQYVSPNVVRELLADKNKLKLGGDKKEVTVFFSDIRGFTTLSETYPPEQVISQLNEYLNAMTEIIFGYEGTLDKFIGDGIMAVWGAPLPQPDHAVRAVKAGLKQLEVLKTLQQKWLAEDKPVLDIGIGINSGEVVVGNVGAARYKDYTVIGDTVNLAARLEHHTRDASVEKSRIVRMVISEATRIRLGDQFIVEPLGTINVKGKKQCIQVWEVIR